MSNATNKYVTPVGLQQPAAADLSDGTTGTGPVVEQTSGSLLGIPTTPTGTTNGAPTNTTQIASTSFAAKVGVPRPNFRRWSYVVADGTFALPNNLGTGDKIVVFTSNGIQSGAAPTGSAPCCFNVSTGNASSAQAHFNGNANYLTGRNIKYQAYMSMTDTYTAVRCWSGVMNSNPTGLTTPIFPIAAFRAVTGVDTNFQCYTSDSVSSTVTDSGVVADNGWHRFEIVFNDSTPNVQFYIDGSLVATNTTHLPISSMDLFFATTIDLPTGSASRTQSVGWFYVETDA